MEILVHTLSVNDTRTGAAIVVLPDDVLKIILEAAYAHSWGDSEHLGAPCTNDTTQVTTATHVSRRWRRVASLLPSLWTCIHVHVISSLDLLTLYLDNSGCRPLSIAGYRDFSQAALTSRHTSCMELLLRRSADRIQYADISSHDAQYFFIPLLRTMEQHPFPSLIHLSLVNWASEDDLDNFRLHLAAPRLKHLRVASVAVAFGCSLFKDLYTLDICHRTITMADLEALSTAAPQLAVLTFEDCDLSIIGPADPVAHLPESLHTLHIRHDTFPAEVILSRIDAPGLECLEIDVAVAYVGHPQGRIYPPRTFPSVHRLIIHMAQSSTSLGTYDGYHFSLTPRATSFHIVDIYGRCDHIVRCLASHPAYLPDLRSLTVDVEFVSRVGVLREPLTVLLSSRRDTLEMVNLSPNLFGDLGEGLLEELGGGPVQVSCT